MLQINKLSTTRVIAFFIGFFVLFFVYYTRMLTVKEGGNKKVKMIKIMMMLFVLFGLVNTFLTTNDTDLRILLLSLIISCIIILNLHANLKKCPTIPTQYKITLYVKIIVIVLISALVLRNANNTGLLTFLYSPEEIKTDVDTNDNISDIVKYKDYCPDMKQYNIPDTAAETVWKSLSSEQKNNCIARKSEIYQREDIDDDIYA